MDTMDYAFVQELPRLIVNIVAVVGIIGLLMLIAGDFARAGLRRHFVTGVAVSSACALLLVGARLWQAGL